MEVDVGKTVEEEEEAEVGSCMQAGVNLRLAHVSILPQQAWTGWAFSGEW